MQRPGAENEGGRQEVGGGTGLFRSRGLVSMLRDWISSEVQGERRPVIPGVEEDCVCVLDPQPHPRGSSIGIKGCGGR